MKKCAKTYSLALSCLIAGTLAMTGCQTIADNNSRVVNPTQAVTLPLADATLQNYRWQLVSVADLVVIGYRQHRCAFAILSQFKLPF